MPRANADDAYKIQRKSCLLERSIWETSLHYSMLVRHSGGKIRRLLFHKTSFCAPLSSFFWLVISILWHFMAKVSWGSFRRLLLISVGKMFRRRVATFQTPTPSLTLYKHRIFTLSRNIKAYKVDGSAVSLLLVILFCYSEWRWKKSGCRGREGDRYLYTL